MSSLKTNSDIIQHLSKVRDLLERIDLMVNMRSFGIMHFLEYSCQEHNPDISYVSRRVFDMCFDLIILDIGAIFRDQGPLKQLRETYDERLGRGNVELKQSRHDRLKEIEEELDAIRREQCSDEHLALVRNEIAHRAKTADQLAEAELNFKILKIREMRILANEYLDIIETACLTNQHFGFPLYHNNIALSNSFWKKVFK